MRSLKAHGFTAFGAATIDESVSAMEILRPEVLVVDPASDECSALLDSASGWQTLGLVAVAETDAAAQRAREMGIEDVVMSDDTSALVDAVLDLLGETDEAPPPDQHTRILVADDEEEILDILTDVLTRRGYAVVRASSGQEALEVVERDPGISMVLLDLIMPGGGIETLKEMKRRYPHITVILMSGVADAAIAHHAVRLGAFDYILKPLDPDELEGRIIAGLAAEEFHHLPWWQRLSES